MMQCMGLSVILTACGRSGTENVPAPAQKTFPLRGTVVRVRKDGTSIAVIRHEEIKGWMEAMTMEFPVPSAPEFAALHPGDEITATVFVRDLDYWIGDIRIIGK